MTKATVILYRPGELTPQGDPIEVDPAMVGAIEADGRDPQNKTLVNVYGVQYRVRGHVQEISDKLGWSGRRHPLQPKGGKPPLTPEEGKAGTKSKAGDL
jgi:hypothetical protein